MEKRQEEMKCGCRRWGEEWCVEKRKRWRGEKREKREKVGAVVCVGEEGEEGEEGEGG